MNAGSAASFLYSLPARLSALFHPAQFFLLLGADLCLDSLLRPPLPHTRHSVRVSGPLQTLLLVSPLLHQACWNLDDLGHCVFQLLLPFCPEILTGAVDDTLARKSGRHIWGADMHHDPLRSTSKRPFFSFGHSWVVFSLQVSFAFAPGKVWALPILVRLYRKRKKSKVAPGRDGKPEKKQTGQASAKQYRTRPQLALEMIQVVARWLCTRKLRVRGDSEYAGGSISRHLPANTELISRMTMNAALYELPPPQTAGRGRRRKKGARLSNPAQICCGTQPQGISSLRNPLSSGFGTRARQRFHSKTFIEI